MPTAAKNPDNSAAIPKGKSCHEFVAQPVVTDITKQLSETSIAPGVGPAAFIAELDGTPIESRKVPVASSSTPSKTPIGDVTVKVVDDTNYEDYEMLAGEKPATAHLLEKIAKVKAAKMKDPAVLINLPSSPSAQAYEVARDAKRPGDKYRFDPTYADTEDENAEPRDNKCS